MSLCGRMLVLSFARGESGALPLLGASVIRRTASTWPSDSDEDRDFSHADLIRTWEDPKGGASVKHQSRGFRKSDFVVKVPTRTFSSSGGEAPSTPPSDPPDSLLMRSLPRVASPYARLMRLDKPIGTWLLLWPSFWSIALAAEPGCLPDVKTLALFGAGAVLLRGAGCTVNDLWDRDLDSKVERTRTRPLAAGDITPLAALAFLGGQLSLGLGVLLQLNPYAQVLGAASLPLVAAYPLMKRVTDWPQAFLGLTINWGALLGWAAVHGSLDWYVTLPLYASGVAWTLVYDTVYAHQDKEDDARVGIRSTALHFGGNERNRRILSGFAAAHGGTLAAAGCLAPGLGAPFLLCVSLGSAGLILGVHKVDLDDPAQCSRFFVAQQWYGAWIFAGIAADKLLL